MFNEYDPFEEEIDLPPSDEKVPFLVPLMMVPESEVGGGFGNGLSFDRSDDWREKNNRKKRPFQDQGWDSIKKIKLEFQPHQDLTFGFRLISA